MGRGRQKAKHTKVARELKYFSPNTDLTALEKEIGHIPPASSAFAGDDEPDGSSLGHRLRDGFEGGRGTAPAAAARHEPAAAGAALVLCSTQQMAQQVIKIGHDGTFSDAMVHFA